MTTTRTTAAALTPGMTLAGTGCTVLTRPVRDITTPAGKVELTIRTATGRVRTVTWTARGVIHVTTPEGAA